MLKSKDLDPAMRQQLDRVAVGAGVADARRTCCTLLDHAPLFLHAGAQEHGAAVAQVRADVGIITMMGSVLADGVVGAGAAGVVRGVPAGADTHSDRHRGC